jgi:nucleotide-binding universal stress UspA family protein
MKHILVATDGSPGAERAVDMAAQCAKAFGGKLSIVTVGGAFSPGEARQLARAERDIADALEGVLDQILADASARVWRAGVSDVHTQTGWGDPAEAILEIARRDGADAIVLGRRGRGRLAGLLLGSVSQKLVSLAPCPVIVVP